MVRARFLLTATLVAVAIASTALPAHAAKFDCGYSGFITGCNTGDAVSLEGQVSVPGDTGSGGSGVDGGGGVVERCLKLDADCLLKSLPGGDFGEAVPGVPAVSLADIAWFRPVPGVQFMQPDGWTVPGLHTNFYAVSGVQLVPGTLLGQAAEVRFTPVAFHWDYGDGTSASLGTGGGTWEQLGVAEFDATPTSHVYEHEGEFTIRSVIDFAAEYRFGDSGWTPIVGRIPLPANELHITVDGAKTVLVEHDCVANPAGPGC